MNEKLVNEIKEKQQENEYNPGYLLSGASLLSISGHQLIDQCNFSILFDRVRGSPTEEPGTRNP